MYNIYIKINLKINSYEIYVYNLYFIIRKYDFRQFVDIIYIYFS